VKYRLLSGCGCGSRLDSLYFSGLLRHDAADFVGTLKVQPKLLGGREQARQAQRGIGADAAALEYDGVDPPSGNVKMLGQLACGYAERLEEFFTQDFAGGELSSVALSQYHAFLHKSR
jgi:hypothetical protein